jgi:hypothetical protein
MDIETYDELHAALRGAVTSRFGERAYLRDVYIYKNEAVVSDDATGKLWRIAYEPTGAGKLQLKGSPIEVHQEVSYVPVNANRAQSSSSEGQSPEEQ